MAHDRGRFLISTEFVTRSRGYEESRQVTHHGEHGELETKHGEVHKEGGH